MPLLNQRNSGVFSNCSGIMGGGCVSPAPRLSCVFAAQPWSASPTFPVNCS